MEFLEHPWPEDGGCSYPFERNMKRHNIPYVLGSFMQRALKKPVVTCGVHPASCIFTHRLIPSKLLDSLMCDSVLLYAARSCHRNLFFALYLCMDHPYIIPAVPHGLLDHIVYS